MNLIIRKISWLENHQRDLAKKHYLLVKCDNKDAIFQPSSFIGFYNEVHCIEVTVYYNVIRSTVQQIDITTDNSWVVTLKFICNRPFLGKVLHLTIL